MYVSNVNRHMIFPKISPHPPPPLLLHPFDKFDVIIVYVKYSVYKNYVGNHRLRAMQLSL